VAVGSTSAPSTIKVTDNSGIPLVMGVGPVRGRDRQLLRHDRRVGGRLLDHGHLFADGNGLADRLGDLQRQRLRRSATAAESVQLQRQGATPASVLKGRF
jgi:hypothetical protein